MGQLMQSKNACLAGVPPFRPLALPHFACDRMFRLLSRGSKRVNLKMTPLYRNHIACALQLPVAQIVLCDKARAG